VRPGHIDPGWPVRRRRPVREPARFVPLS
jgi:hypothetical protein